MKTFITSAACFLGLAMTACAQPAPTAGTTGADSTNIHIAGMPAAYISQEDFIRASEQTVNGVVSVKSFATPQNRYGGNRQQGYGADPFSDPFFEFFFGGPGRNRVPQQTQPEQKPQQRQIGLGSGVIISSDGYVITNNHVIADAERLEVTLNDNRNFTATVVGADPTTDIALLKIENAPADLHVIPMGDSEHLHVGEWVLAVGNPFGFTSTVTSGIVSAKARNISSSTGAPATGGIESYIQTDAAVNSGNSGGALVNLRGELVGINTAIYSQTGAYAGCSFAIPTSIAQKVVADLKRYGTVQRALLGIRFAEVTPELIVEKSIKGTSRGIYVASVEDLSAAREAGLREGDIILALDSYPTHSTAEMQEAITKFSPGDRVAITYMRDGAKHTAHALLRNAQGTTATVRDINPDHLGATFKAIEPERLEQLQISAGVEVESVDSDGPFAAQGMRPGFIILAINQTRVSSPEQVKALARSILKANSRERVMFISGFYPGGRQAFYAIDLNN